jgi:hypothetical protein
VHGEQAEAPAVESEALAVESEALAVENDSTCRNDTLDVFPNAARSYITSSCEIRSVAGVFDISLVDI